MVKLILCDFDGTITKEDVLDKICEHVGKKAESEAINREYQAGKIDGLSALKKRFDLTRGIALSDITNILSTVEYTNGVKELFDYARKHDITTLVISGNAEFVLQYFKEKLDYAAYRGSIVDCRNGIIQGWNAKCRGVDKKLAVEEYLKVNEIKAEEIIAIGDSTSDNALYEVAAHRFIINQKTSVNFNVHTIQSFTEIIKYIEKLYENT